MGLAVCSDFDGTVCVPDSCDYVLSRFAPPEWKRLDEAVWRGEITEREALVKQVSLLRVTWEEARAALREGVSVRPGFADFVRFCRREGIPFTILSSGLRELIDEILKWVNVSDVTVRSNRAEISGDRWQVKLAEGPRLAEHCSHCKCPSVIAAKAAGKVVYIGDGYTDLCPVQHADLIFATGRLASECSARGRPFIFFETFSEIERELARLIRTERDSRP